jgi:hypothetical protein
VSSLHSISAFALPCQVFALLISSLLTALVESSLCPYQVFTLPYQAYFPCQVFTMLISSLHSISIFHAALSSLRSVSSLHSKSSLCSCQVLTLAVSRLHSISVRHSARIRSSYQVFTMPTSSPKSFPLVQILHKLQQSAFGTPKSRSVNDVQRAGK